MNVYCFPSSSHRANCSDTGLAFNGLILGRNDPIYLRHAWGTEDLSRMSMEKYMLDIVTSFKRQYTLISFTTNDIYPHGCGIQLQ